MMMIKSVVAVSTAMAISAAGPAFAQQQSDPAINGTIRSLDPGTNTIVLDDGQSYRLGDGVEMGALREGSRVTLSCDDTGANCMVMAAGGTGELGPETQGLSPEEQTQPSAGSGQGKGGGGPSATPGLGDTTAGNGTASDATADDAIAGDAAIGRTDSGDQTPARSALP